MNIQNCHSEGFGNMEAQQQAGQPSICIPLEGLKIAPLGGLKLTPAGLAIDCSILQTLCNFRKGSAYSEASDCGVTWSLSPTQVGQNQPIAVQVAGLQPYGMATLLVKGPNNTQTVVSLSADNTGTVSAAAGSVIMDGPEGNYEAVLLVAGCKLDPESVGFQVVNFAAQQACQGYVTVTPQFSNSSFANGGTGSLLIALSNSNAGTVTVTLPQITLPAGLSSSLQIGGTQHVLNGGETKTLSYVVSAANTGTSDLTATLNIAAGAATYLCGGQVRSAGGGQASVAITPPPLPACQLQLISLVSDKSSASSGSPVTLTAILKNGGQNVITGINGSVNVGGSGIATTPITPQLVANGLTLQPGASIPLTVTFTPVLTNPGAGAKNITVTLQAGVFVGSCNGSSVGSIGSYSTTIVVTP